MAVVGRAAEIEEIVDRETRAWDTQDVGLLLSIFHPDFVWVWPSRYDAHDPADWKIGMGRFDADRWRRLYQDLFDTHELVRNDRSIVKVEVSDEGDGAFAVVDIDTRWRHRATGDVMHWRGRVCKVYALVGGEWKLTMHTGALDYSPGLTARAGCEHIAWGDEPRLYGELASWFHLLTAAADYEEEAQLYHDVLVDAAEGPVERVLELGSGGGNNASHLKRHFELTLVDRSPEMLEISRGLNPECRHLEGDMRHVRLGEEFDAVFVHDAVSYLTTEADVAAAAETAFRHCRAGGAALFVPDHVRETFAPATRCGGHDGGDGRALRYLEWTWDPDPADTTYLADYAYLLRDRDGVRVVHDRHVCGLFESAAWLRLLAAAGFDATSREATFEDDTGTRLFVGRRRPA